MEPQQLHNASAVENTEVNLPTTLTTLTETNCPQQSYDEVVINEAVTVSEDTRSTAADSLELGCDDKGLIVIQTDVKQVEEENTTPAFKEEKLVARTK